jgi:hypothetical protein
MVLTLAAIQAATQAAPAAAHTAWAVAHTGWAVAQGVAYGALTGLGAAPSPGPGWNLDPQPVAPPGMEEVAATFLGWGKWVLMVSGVLGFMICAGMMIVGRRGRSQTAVDGAAGVPWVLAGLSLTGLAAGIATVVLT